MKASSPILSPRYRFSSPIRPSSSRSPLGKNTLFLPPCLCWLPAPARAWNPSSWILTEFYLPFNNKLLEYSAASVPLKPQCYLLSPNAFWHLQFIPQDWALNYIPPCMFPNFYISLMTLHCLTKNSICTGSPYFFCTSTIALDTYSTITLFHFLQYSFTQMDPQVRNTDG